MTPELEKLIEDCNVKFAELGYKIGSVVEIEIDKKIGGGTKNPK